MPPRRGESPPKPCVALGWGMSQVRQPMSAPALGGRKLFAGALQLRWGVTPPLQLRWRGGGPLRQPPYRRAKMPLPSSFAGGEGEVRN